MKLCQRVTVSTFPGVEMCCFGLYWIELLIVFAFCLFSVSTIVYRLTEILAAKKKGDIKIEVPDDFPIKNLDRFLEDSIDLTDEVGGGMSFYDMDVLIKNNEDIQEEFGNEDNTELVERLRAQLKDEGMKQVVLTHHRYIKRKYACVYSIVKDKYVLPMVSSLPGKQYSFLSQTQILLSFSFHLQT